MRRLRCCFMSLLLALLVLPWSPVVANSNSADDSTMNLVPRIPESDYGDAPDPSYPTLNRAIWLVDDFEDGYLWDTWTDYGGSCNPFILTTPPTPCPEGEECLEIFGDCGDFYQGISTDLLGFPATGFSIYVMSSHTDTANAYVVLDDDDEWINGTVAFFFGNGLADWMFSSGGIGYNCGPRVANQWYLLHFNFDWTSRTVDVFIDGTLKHAGIPMTSSTANGLNYLYLFNYQAGTSYYDFIIASTPPPLPPIFIDGFESGDGSRWSVVVGLHP